MKRLLLISTLASISLLLANNALADRDHHRHGHGHHKHHHHHETVVVYERDYYAPVTDVRPIYREVAVDVPRESCQVETVAYRERQRGGDSFQGTVVGGLIGAAIGKEIGNSGHATAAGGLIGAAIGNDVAGGGRTVTRYEDRPKGQIDLWGNSSDSEGINLVGSSIAGPSSMKSLIHHLVSLRSCTARGLLASLLLISLPACAESDLLGGDMGLSTSSPANGMIDSSRINNDDTPTEPPPPQITPAQAAELVRRSTGGQVMSVNSQQTGSGVVYGVKVLNSGRMKVVRVDGQTGQIINN